MADESFVMVSLNDDKSKELAEVISNKTSRKILDTLTKKEYAESDLAVELDLPISTIHYNLQHLMKAKLVAVDEFHYSKKGKEINHYKLANKFVIITPSETPPGFMEKLRKILPVTVLVAASAVLLKMLNFFTLSRATVETADQNILLQSAMPETFDAVADKSVEITQYELAASVSEDSIRETSTTSDLWHSILSSQYLDYLFWFLLGALCVLLVYIIIEYIKHKLKK